MAGIEHGSCARGQCGERDVRTSGGVLLSHVWAVWRNVQTRGPMSGSHKVRRIATSQRVDLLVGDYRIGCRSQVYRTPAHVPRYKKYNICSVHATYK